MEQCKLCEGNGYTEIANGPEDVDMNVCEECEGAGAVEVMPF